jgi:hypothetical protein
MSLTTTVTAGLTGTQVNTVGGLVGTLSATTTGTFSASLATGTGASQADLIYQSSRTLAASTAENLDLAGVLADSFGAVLTFVKVKAIYIKASSANTNNVVVGGHATAAFLGPFVDSTDKQTIPPGGCVLWAAPVSGWTVTATTADLLKVENSAAGTSVAYDIAIVGTSA